MTLEDLIDALEARARNAADGLSNDAIDFHLEGAPGLPELRQAVGGLFGVPLSPWTAPRLVHWLSESLQAPRADVLAAELPDVVAMVDRARS